MQIDMKQPILDKNDQLASELRARFAENRVFVLDLLASPGSGKTSTILATIEAGANAITYTPPTSAELFAESMRKYRGKFA